ncbi:MAG: hypothetical protein IM542_01155 [Pseudanabaena sp. M165S2SP1A06QC]|nr:hypothetical protein [Pseudanabaena sp. M165S2SP1A06QC]
MLRFRRSGFVGGEGRSLFDVGNRRSGFVGDEGRSLFDLGNRRSRLWGVIGDHCLIWEIGDHVYGW